MNKSTLNLASHESGALFRERFWVPWIVLSVDIMALQFALLVGNYIYLTSSWWPITISSHQYYDSACAMALLPLGFWLMRLYPGYGLSLVERFRIKVRTTVNFFLIIILWEYFDSSPRSSGLFLIVIFLALIFPALFQTILRYVLIKYNVWGTPVIIIGAELKGRTVVSSLEKNPSLGFRPIAILDDDKRLWGKIFEGVPIVGGIEEAGVFSDVTRYAIIALQNVSQDRIVHLSEFLPFQTIMIVPNLIGLQSQWVEVRDLGGIPGMEIRRNLLMYRNRLLKHCLDYVLSVPLFLISLPILLFAAICIRISSPGSPFYTQEREGANGKAIRIFKLRTMYQDAEQQLSKHLEENDLAKKEWQQYFKLKKDPRILPFIGTLLRKTSLDELPQLWNVLRGEMNRGPSLFTILTSFQKNFVICGEKFSPV